MPHNTLAPDTAPDTTIYCGAHKPSGRNFQMRNMLRRALKAVVPDKIRRTLAYARKSYAQPFAGVYASFNDAPKSVGYLDASWDRMSAGAAEDARNQIGTRLPTIEPGKWLLPMLVQGLPGPVRILDFGGAAGLDYASLRAALTSGPEIAYHVVDMPGTCEAGRKVWADHPEVTFSSSIPDGQFDVVYAYSSIHCIDDWRDNLKRLAACGAKHILICKTPIHLGQSFVRGQVNMAQPLAHWVLNLGDVESALAAGGYKLAFKTLGEVEYNVENFDGFHRVGKTAHLLFTRA